MEKRSANRIPLAVAALALVGASVYFGRHLLRHLVEEEKPKPAPVYDLYNAKSKVFKRGRRDEKVLCLTIDDGPHPQSAKRILDTLLDYDVRATFFLVGRRIAEHPEVVREIVREGNEVGNHTENHLRLDNLPPAQVRQEIEACEQNFEAATGGTKMTLFRPPGMRFTPDVLKIAREYGYTTVDWNYGAKDFKPLTKEQIVDYVTRNVTPGGIILLHDSPETADALPEILSKLKGEGYTFVTATQMMSRLPEPVEVACNAAKLGPMKDNGFVTLEDFAPLSIYLPLRSVNRAFEQVRSHLPYRPSADYMAAHSPATKHN